MANVKLGNKIYENVETVKLDTADGASVEFAPYEETFAAGKAEGIEEGYANGKTEGIAEGIRSEYDRFWDSYQNKGERKKYEFAFSGYDGWNDDTFQPKYDLVLGDGYTGGNMFNGCQVVNLAAKLESLGVKLDTTRCGHLEYMFANAQTVRIPEINATSGMEYSTQGLLNTFANSTIETIDRLVVVEGLKYYNTFLNGTSLKHITFDGVISEDINFQWSPLTVDSIRSVVTHLSDSAAEKTVTFNLSAVNNAFETGEGAADGSTSAEWAALIATKPNWTITLV